MVGRVGGVDGKTAEEFAMVPGDETRTRVTLSTSTLESDATGSNSSNMERRETERAGSS